MIRQELQALVDASFPDLAACGLRAADLRSLRLVVDPSSGVQGRIVGLPSLGKLRACPMIPDIFAVADARGWVLEDERPGTLRVRRRHTARLPDEAFEFAAPAERWLHVRATAGPPTRSVTVTVEDSDEHGMLLRIDAPVDVIAAAGSWCDRALERQESLGTRHIGGCLAPSPTTLQILPSSQESSDFVALTAAMRNDLFETFEVHGNSMLPTVRDGDVVFVDKLERGKVPARGDIVLFDGGEGVKLAKRVIALPGEELELSAEGLRIDGRALRSSPTGDTESASSCGVRLLAQHLDAARFDFIADISKKDTVTARVPEGHVFVLGDNRPVSRDSRAFGSVDVRAIDGVARFIAWSVVGERLDWERATTSLHTAPCSATTDCPDAEQAIR
ncbi:signal peptidase I [Nannocystis radixulma]|uniref:Signal peptidase I n=1 Tax=Nannocystis radixulma TaxID=2995305 RepID=A0ABT5B4W5_9BACT|nr:signal peptidase I [Nannocystis radixulma]MDC0669131.1 signal peptidase I [Nannocystis radixulma]